MFSMIINTEPGADDITADLKAIALMYVAKICGTLPNSAFPAGHL